MTVLALLRYLVGHRSTILQLAASPMTFVCGILFTISAGFAREYDGEDLLHEPWHALRPLAASLASGTVLFVLVHGVARVRTRAAGGEGDICPPGLWRAWRTFMGLFWMTAPLAWLYAVPYERMLEPVAAIEANLWTLTLVAAWRVILITRVIGVVYGIRAAPAFFLVMLFADAVAFAVVNLVPAPVFMIMGGVRGSEADALIGGMTFCLWFLAVLSAPVWIIGSLVSFLVIRPGWTGFATPPENPKARGLLALAAISVVAWTPALLVAQPEQINRRDAERLVRIGAVSAAFAIISSKDRGDYPPHWDPPPRLGYDEREPSLVEVRAAMRDRWPADWLAGLYLDKIRRDFRQDLGSMFRHDDWASIVERFQDRQGLDETALDRADTAAFLLEYDSTLTADDRTALERLVAAGREKVEADPG